MRIKAILICGLLLSFTAPPAFAIPNDLYPDGVIYDFKDFAIFAHCWKSDAITHTYCNDGICITIESLDCSDLWDFANKWLYITAEDIADAKVLAARDAADAGLELAISRVIGNWNDSSNWPGNIVPTQTWTPLGGSTYGNAEYSYTVTGNNPMGIQLASTGRANDAVHNVHATLTLRSSFFGIGAGNAISINNGANLGTVPSGEEFLIMTSSTSAPPQGGVNIRNGVFVPGDVVIGPGGDTNTAIVEKKDIVIEGEARTARYAITYPAICPPILPSATLTEDPADPNGNTLLINSSGIYSSIYVGAGGDLHTTLKVVGDVAVVVGGPMILGAGTELVVTEGSSLKIYLENSLLTHNDGAITYGDGVHVTDAEITEAATSLSIKGTPNCNSIIIQNSGDIYGTVYAPDADVEIKNSGDYYGALLGGSMNLNNAGSFFFVSALYDLLDVEVMYMGIMTGSWWEDNIELTDNVRETLESVVRKSSYRPCQVGASSLTVYYYSSATGAGDSADELPDSYAYFYLDGSRLMLDTGTCDTSTNPWMIDTPIYTEIIAENVSDLHFTVPDDSTDIEMTVTINGQPVTYSASRHN